MGQSERKNREKQEQGVILVIANAGTELPRRLFLVTTTRLIFVERSRARAAELAEALEPVGRIEWEWTGNAQDARAMLSEDFDAVFADWDVLGGVDGVRAIGYRPRTPLIVTTEKIDQHDVVDCLRAGATDCVRRTHHTRIRAALSEALERHDCKTEGTIDEARYHELMRDLSRADRRRSEFVGNLSHELRTPLNVIMGYSDLLLDDAFGPLNDEQTQTITRICKQARELLDLVNTTLELSRVEAGRIPLDVEPVDLAELLAEIAEETNVLAERKNIEVLRELPEDIAQPETDPVKLKIIAKNLITNALKFTETGSVRIVARERDRGVEIAVIDTGPGIPEHQLETIFEAFEQGDSAKGQRGAGLGLHIVQRLLAILGGTVELETCLGEGSTFRVWIPLQRPVAEDEEGRSGRVSAA